MPGQLADPLSRDRPRRIEVGPSNITGDGNWYSSASGTSNTVIHVCGTNPSHDATLLIGTKRKLGVSFPAPITGSVIAESVTGAYQSGAFINVYNILCAGCFMGSQPFTTRMTVQLSNIVDRNDYRLRFRPYLTDTPARHPDTLPADNTPYESSPVLVVPQPYDCAAGGATKPSWIVRGTTPSSDPSVPINENLQVGTLYRIESTSTVHAGQYSMPFEIRIEALTCFSY